MGHNLILLVTDTLRSPESLPPQKFSRAAPFLTDLAAAGWSVPKFVASSSWTYPSHLALLHGMEPWEPSLELRTGRFDRSRPTTISEAWRDAGGASAAFSRNPMVTPETGLLRGYDRTLSPGALSRSGLAVGLNCLWDTVEGSLADRARGEPWRELAARGPRRASRVLATGLARLTRSAFSSAGLLRSLRNYLKESTGRAPLHRFVNFMEAHEPYLPGPCGREWAAPEGPPATANLSFHASTGVVGASVGPALLERYLAAVAELDRRIAEVFSLLRREGFLRDATVIVVSDHGQSLGEHGYLGHGRRLYDELIRVPCLIWSTRAMPELRWAHQTFFDHRHLHEVLGTAVVQGRLPTDRDWKEVAERRGPAYSHVRWREFQGHNPLRRSSASEAWRRFPSGPDEGNPNRHRGHEPSPDRPTEESTIDSLLTEADRCFAKEVGGGRELSAPGLPLDTWGYGE